MTGESRLSLPDAAAAERGVRLAGELIEKCRRLHGIYAFDAALAVKISRQAHALRRSLVALLEKQGLGEKEGVS
jgi:hypothetical protein